MREAAPPVGQPLAAAPGIRRIVAPNPGAMTGNGTNCWLVDHPGGTAIIDPGSDDPAHLHAIRAAAGPVTHILLTHTHRDHLTGARPLGAATGAPVCGFRHSAVADFTPDIALDDGSAIAGLTAVHTPGHATDHLCFVTADGIVFTGDHIMGWSTTMVPPAPQGSVRQFLDGLARIDALDARLLLPAHGPSITAPAACIRALIDHRLTREATILAALDAVPATLEDMMRRVYRAVPPALHRAAEMNLLAHLEKLREDGHAVHGHDGWRVAPGRPGRAGSPHPA
ncbi:beta-lactamase domain protein [Gluconacetobacter diazotrophicus PA1 5]|uniref:MBL fold metallo-hydrolase n=2 Tax=Gluconacetobacter diazotrophicus TaxID=33996 RepID=A0A7W4I6H6_GLUDI|nr:MBL fold metallo-hydrolase [Gluconacetobacter diazotrophicus]ACI53032.1 beta-lactamase domain protein [Gluconacetobacter diazotrophicus PA1 5]MBB2157175.1 MBL fold metallo-hydrolase [Gluconacetobacter diazotrophicus]TWB07703.1 glyoxylase-like metal-dependent hydrolase (beta-lactamase superfamily II) [Gluconacetobacter diazotrophicus]CAP57006.1 putative metallo-beta-lactamase superfamily protein [Gluconacetobacter diazotrophicus PA1 5]